MDDDLLAAILKTMHNYQVSHEIPIWVYYRFSSEERQAIDIHAALMNLGQKPVSPQVLETAVGKELFDKISDKWTEGYEYAQRGAIVVAVTLDDYNVPLDDVI